MRTPIELPILFHTEVSIDLEELGIESDEFQVKTAYFYVIDSVMPRIDNDNQTSVWSCGSVFVCDLPIDETLKIINEHH